MNIKDITTGSMVCAIYGALLFFNQQSALLIESTLSWIFVFPVLIYTSIHGVRCGIYTCLAMAIMTFLFGSFTTWFYSWTSLIVGYVYGLGIYKRWKNKTNLIICFFCSVISNVFIVVIWSNIFGFDPNLEFESIKGLVPFMDFNAFIVIFIIFLSLLQSICIHLIAILICIRMHIPFQPLCPITKIKSPRWPGFVSPVIWAIFFLCQNVVEWYYNLFSLVQILWVLDCMVLLYYGVLYFMHYCIVYNKKGLSFFAILGAFVPILNCIWMFFGQMDCLFQLRKIE